jgi:hypothetical protein
MIDALAQALRSDDLTEVHPPTLEEEAVRDLSRCREDAREDLLRAGHRLGKMLLRRGLVHNGKAWTEAHRRWLRGLNFEHEAARAVFDDYLRAIEHLEERLSGLEEKLIALGEKAPYREPVGRQRCFRGIDTITGARHASRSSAAPCPSRSTTRSTIVISLRPDASPGPASRTRPRSGRGSDARAGGFSSGRERP